MPPTDGSARVSGAIAQALEVALQAKVMRRVKQLRSEVQRVSGDIVATMIAVVS